MFSKLLAVFLLLLPGITFAAIAFQNYESLVVPQHRKYPNYGFFYSFQLGYNNNPDLDVSPSISDDLLPDPPDPTIKLDSGGIIGGAIGFRNKHFRTEAELSLRYSSGDTVRGLPLELPMDTSVTADGDVIVGSLLVNFYIDFLIGNWIPFIGAGVGGAYVSNTMDATVFDTSGMDPEKLGSPEFSDSGIGIAYQLIIGIAYIINEHHEIDLVYKYFETKPGKYSNSSYLFTDPPDPILDGTEVEFSPKYSAQTLAIEWRISP